MVWRGWSRIRPSALPAALALVLAAGAPAAHAAGQAAPRSVDAVRVDAVMKRNGFVHGGRSGASVAIAVDGHVVFARGYGDADTGTPDRWEPATADYYGAGRGGTAPRPRAPATADTIYEAGSISKTVVAAAVHALAEKGALSVDDKVTRWFHAFSSRPELRVRNLLEQTSGIPDFNQLEYVHRFRGKPIRSLIDALASEPPLFPAGARFEYSNSNYLLLGRIVEIAADQPLEDYLARRFFTPLGMTRTRFFRSAAGTDVAVGYTLQDRERVRAYSWDLRWIGGAGGLVTDAPDLARFDAALIDGHMIAAASFAAMGTPSAAKHPLFVGPYAHALILDRIGSHRELWHNGAVGGFHAMHALFPDDRIAIVVLTNQLNASPERLIGPLLAAVVPVTEYEQGMPQSSSDALRLLFSCALTGLLAAIGAGIWRRRPVWGTALVALGAGVAGCMLPLFVEPALAFALALVPAVVFALIPRANAQVRGLVRQTPNERSRRRFP
jgi:D-alanyl-D-alanine carboxypeptidase